MMARVRTLGIELLGWLLLALAVLLSPLPLVPSLLIICGLAVLSTRYTWANRLLEKTLKLVPAWMWKRRTAV
jgi:hypothetical protein